MIDRKVEILEHTADLAIRIHAADERELFELGARTAYDLIGRTVPSDEDEKSYLLDLKATDLEELFHDWLAEILYWFQVRQILFERFDFETLHAAHLKVSATGRKIDPDRSVFRREIKAVTYHRLEIERTPHGLTATVIFDI